MHLLHDVIGDGHLPNPYDDADLLARHAAHGTDPADVIYLSLGETWTQAAPGLRAALATVPLHAHGYVLTPYGLPALQRVLRSYLPATHHLDDVAALGEDYEVAVCQGSTRQAMADFGRLLTGGDTTHRGIVVHVSPGWDYAGVFTPLGYRMQPVPLTPENGYQPDPAEVAAALHLARARTTGPVILVVNAQHNPTGANWAPDTVRAMVHAAYDVDANVLIDDAYYGVHDPHITPTSALRILLQEYGRLPRHRRPHWLAVRSLGKQNHCNGWGIGVLSAPPPVVETLCARMLPQRGYVTAVPLQAAMATWLDDPASQAYLHRQRADYAAKRRAVTTRLHHDLGWPEDGFFPGECGPYLLIPTPTWHTDPVAGGEDFRHYLLRRTGVLLGEAHMTTPGQPALDSGGHVRLYLGPPATVLHTALDRMVHAGLHWSTPPLSTGGRRAA